MPKIHRKGTSIASSHHRHLQTTQLIVIVAGKYNQQNPPWSRTVKRCRWLYLSAIYRPALKPVTVVPSFQLLNRVHPDQQSKIFPFPKLLPYLTQPLKLHIAKTMPMPSLDFLDSYHPKISSVSYRFSVTHYYFWLGCCSAEVTMILDTEGYWHLASFARQISSATLLFCYCCLSASP